MSCLRWVCRWNAPVPPSVSHLASGQLRKKSPLLVMRLTESRSEPKTRANMPLLRQLEFAFRSTNLLFVGPPGVSPGELINESAGKMPAGHTAGTAVLLKTARELLCSLGAKRIATELRAGRRRISPHGPQWQQACRDLGIADEKRCHTLPFPAKSYAPRFIYRCPNCRRDFPRVRKIKRTVACLACCRAHNGGEFDGRFRLKLLTV